MKLTDEQLVEACQQGDQRAYRELYNRYAPKMLGLLMRYIGDRDAAQDVLHDGFIKVFEHLSSLGKAQSLDAWMGSIMVRTALNTLRSHKRRGVWEPIEVDSLAHEEPIDLPYEPHQIVRAMAQLDATSRLVLNLYEVEDYSAEELADEFGLKPASIRSICCRARRQLREALEKM